MDLERVRRRTWLSWACVTLLALLCATLAALQYHWLGEVATVERDRLRDDLHTKLSLLRRHFNAEISAACSVFVPSPGEIERLGRDEAYLARYRNALESQDGLIRRIGLAVPNDGQVILLLPDAGKNRFEPASWPPEWAVSRIRLEAQLRHEPPGETERRAGATVVEIPRFASTEQEWLLLELNVDYIRHDILPALLNRHLGNAAGLPYDAEVVTNSDPPVSIYRSSTGPERGTAHTADASIPLLDIDSMPRHRGDRPGPPPGPPPFGDGPRPPMPPPDSGRGAWLLLVHSRAGSLEALVEQARWRNIALSGSILLLILATVWSLVRFSRKAQQMADLQMNFVAGVSHELRTPLTIIRTAAFNLRTHFSNRPQHVERYGRLIESESAKLAALVEQILRYGSVQAGRVIREREPVEVEALIESSLRSGRIASEGARLIVDTQVEPGLPPVLADEAALRHALQNLLDNAVKYGTEGSNWIGVFAESVGEEQAPAVEIRVVDRGPGIPPEEQEHVFDPFFRGRRAVRDQLHGTGLGLNLAKKIVEAHGGTIQVRSEPMSGTEFIVRIPAAPPELQNEFAHSIS